MARLFTSGFELKDPRTTVTVASEPAIGGTNAPTFSTSTFRSGLVGLSCASGAGNGTSTCLIPSGATASTTSFIRCYYRFTDLPGATTTILVFGTAGSNGFNVQITSAGVLQVFNNQVGGQIGLDSAALSTDTWYRIEMSIATDASVVATAVVAKIDGTDFVNTSNSQSNAFTGAATLGWVAAPGANKTLFLDDIAKNDSTGAAQNTWPGEGKVVLAIPVSDNARTTGWVTGAGGTTSLFDAVNNTPPVGVADTGTATSQIRNATAEASASYDANLTTYTNLGIAAADTINVVVPIVATGAPVTTSSKQGLIGMASNPAITTVALDAAGTAGAFWSGVAAATYQTGWKWSKGTTTYAPSVTKGSSPVARITQVTSSTRIADVCFLGMYVEYTPATAKAPPFQARTQRNFLLRR